MIRLQNPGFVTLIIEFNRHFLAVFCFEMVDCAILPRGWGDRHGTKDEEVDETALGGYALTPPRFDIQKDC